MSDENLGFSRQLHDSLAAVDKRDWELWFLVITILAILTLGLACVVYPAVFLGQTSFDIYSPISAPAVLATVVFFGISFTYFVRARRELQKRRHGSINAVVQYQIDNAPGLLDNRTQVFPRSALQPLIEKEIQRVKRKQSVLTILYADIENLRTLTARVGHLTGDLVLAEVAAILKRSVRGCDFIVRLEAAEFLVLLVETDSVGGNAVKSRIHSQITVWNASGLVQDFSLVVNIGMATFDGNRQFDAVIRDAKAKTTSTIAE